MDILGGFFKLLLPESLLDLASNGNTVGVVSYLDSRPIGTVNSERNSNSKTALHLAASNGHTNTVGMLIFLNADIHAIDNNLKTALHLAASNGHTKTVNKLIYLKADINAVDRGNKTPLHWAAQDKQKYTAEKLISLNANTTALDSGGFSAYQYMPSLEVSALAKQPELHKDEKLEKEILEEKVNAAAPPSPLPTPIPADVTTAQLSARVFAAYNAVDVTQLTIREGDIIHVTKRDVYPGWSAGLGGLLFPSNYVDFLSPSISNVPAALPAPSKKTENDFGFKVVSYPIENLEPMYIGNTCSVYSGFYTDHMEDGHEVIVKSYEIKKANTIISENYIKHELDIFGAIKDKTKNLPSGVSNFLKLHGSGETAVCSYLIVEKFGMNLTNCMGAFQNGNYGIVKDLIECIKNLHDLGIVHNDIKPENILYKIHDNYSSQFKLCDFDSAVYQGQDFPLGKFSPGYVSPEVWHHSKSKSKTPLKADFSIDVFSLGLVLALVLDNSPGGKGPHNDFTMLPAGDDVLLKAILNNQTLLNAKIKCGKSVFYQKVVQRMVEIDPKNRLSLVDVLKGVNTSLTKKVEEIGIFEKQISIGQKIDGLVNSVIDVVTNTVDYMTVNFTGLHESVDLIKENVVDIKEIVVSLEDKLDKLARHLDVKFDFLGNSFNGFTDVLLDEMVAKLENASFLEDLIASTKKVTSSLISCDTSEDAAKVIEELKKEIQKIVSFTEASNATLQTQLMSCKENIENGLTEVKDVILASQASSSDELRRSLDLVSQRTVLLQENLSSLHEEVKALHARFEDFGRASRAVLDGSSLLATKFDSLEKFLMEERAQSLETQKGLESTLTDLNDKLLKIASDVEKSLISEEILTIKNKLDTLLSSTFDLPSLFVIFPKSKSGLINSLNPLQFVQDEYELRFICRYSLRLSPKTYSIKMPKSLVVKAAPVLKVCLGLLKAVLTTYGIPLPIPLDAEDLITAHSDLLRASFQACIDDTSDIIGSYLDNVKESTVDDYIGLIDGPSLEGIRQAYETIKEVLEGKNIVKTCGLVQRNTDDGHVMWILDDEAVKKSFESTGGKPKNLTAAEKAELQVNCQTMQDIPISTGASSTSPSRSLVSARLKGYAFCGRKKNE